MGQLLLTYAEAHAAGPTIAGGKGWNLARLDRYGFPVPRGGVLSAEVYHAIVARPSVAKMMGELARVPAEEIDSEVVRGQLLAVREAFQQEIIPEPAIAELEGFLVREELVDVPVAVRSSASAEDGELASFAGIHESFLNVIGLEAIVAAIHGCYASLWTPQALAYRRRWGIADSACGCAVVICRMVSSAGGGPPRAAGVAFSCDPRTGRRDLVVINAAPGLGDALVRGIVNPQQFVVRPSGMRWSIVERPNVSTFPQPALTDDQVQELALQTLRVQWALGDGQHPQDVEWAHDGERFWLVQARPVTHLPRWTFPPIAGQPLHWSNANVKDVVPGVLTILSWSLVQEIVSRILYTVLEEVDYEIPPGMEVLRRFSGRAYFDLTAMQWAFYDGLGSRPSELNRDLGGTQPEIEVPSGDPLRGVQGRRRFRARLRFFARIWRFEHEIGPKIANVLGEARAARGFDATRRSLSELHRELLRWEDLIGEFGPLFQLSNGYCGAWLTLMRSLANRLDRERGESLVSRLLAGTGQVTSAEHGYRLWDLAQVARRDPQALAWLSGTPAPESLTAGPDPLGWQALPPNSPFRQSLERYLHDFGHRAAQEGEIANPRWIDDATFLLAQVRAEIDGGESRDPREAAAHVRAGAETDLRRTTWLFRPLARWLVRRTRRGMGLREAAKSAVVASLEPVRRIMLELGRRLVGAGHLDAADDVFHLANRDLEAYLVGRWDGRGARALAADRIAQRLAWQCESPPDLITWTSSDDSHAPAAGRARGSESIVIPAAVGPVARWRGVAVSPGWASGSACVLHSPLEGGRLRRGDVLVAPSTDPGWTPLFLRAGAVVMETGGYLSHGAIVAREYGLPAVANLPGILQHIANGDRLVVDGDAGEVVRLEEEVRDWDTAQVVQHPIDYQPN